MNFSDFPEFEEIRGGDSDGERGRRGRGHHGRSAQGRGERGERGRQLPPGSWGPYQGPRGRRGGRSGRGDVRAALLVLIAEQPRHGYELMQEIGERTGGAWTPSPGSVYPALQQLQDEGLVTIETEGGRGVAHLTTEGEEYVAEAREQLEAAFSSNSDSGLSQKEAWNQVKGLMVAFKQVTRVGTPAQIKQATLVVEDAQRKLYAVLAQAPTDIDEDDENAEETNA